MLALLVIGDWSSDGHGRTETIRIDHNLTSNSALQKAYKAGAAILGHDIEKVVAEDYQDGSCPEEVMDALIQHGIMEKDPAEDYWGIKGGQAPIVADDAYSYGDRIHFNSELYAAVWMEVAKLGEPTLVYTTPKRSYEDRINIGGYGFLE